MARLDIEIVNRGLARSRALAQSYIVSDDVTVNNIVVNKASKNINDGDEIIIKNKLKYASRGGLKLEKALNEFLPPFEGGLGWGLHGFKCLDIGSSTGGFTDCLLQHGATHVTAVDVGSNQLDDSLRDDDRITLYENTDIRNFNPHPQPLPQGEGSVDYKFDFITIDVSFISLTKIIPYLGVFCFAKHTKVIALIKPQFEVGRGNLNKNGIVKVLDENSKDNSDTVYNEVINNVKSCFEENGFTYVGHIDSPIAGGDGNREFLMCVEY